MGTAVSTDIEQVVAAATDYLSSFYSGTAEERAARILRVLHPRLAKRTPRMDHEWTVPEMVDIAAGSVNEDAQKRPYSVRVLDISGRMASVRTDAAWGIDYMHLARIDGEWKVVNVLWDNA